jgi:hypothetical protein
MQLWRTRFLRHFGRRNDKTRVFDSKLTSIAIRCLSRLFLVPAQDRVGSVFDAAQGRLAPRLRAPIVLLVLEECFEWTLRIFRLRI